jgi:hypothetical protein
MFMLNKYSDIVRLYVWNRSYTSQRRPDSREEGASEAALWCFEVFKTDIHHMWDNLSIVRERTTV